MRVSRLAKLASHHDVTAADVCNRGVRVELATFWFCSANQCPAVSAKGANARM